MQKFMFLLAFPFLISGCGGSSNQSSNGGDTTEQRADQGKTMEILAGGATFPYPLYSKMFGEYKQSHQVKVNYQSIGSGGGIRQLKNKTVDFGATDAFMNQQELASVEDSVVHLPTCLGAVTVSYNLPNKPDLNFTPGIVADISLGNITKWNDEKIQKVNPDVDLPNQKIVFVHRSDGSGTTFIFTDYLAKVDDEWKHQVGKGKSVNWPTGLGAKGNSGVAGLIKQTPGAIGYIELAYAIQNDMSVGAIKNKSGNFIEPTLESTRKAADIKLPDDTRITLTNTDADQGYPLSSFTWLILYKDQAYKNKSKEKVKSIVNLMWWMIHDGQQYTKPLHYAPLSDKAVKKAEAILKSVTYNGEPVLEDQVTAKQ